MPILEVYLPRVCHGLLEAQTFFDPKFDLTLFLTRSKPDGPYIRT